jgi:hypothetical protein
MNKSSRVVSETPVYQTEHAKGEKKSLTQQNSLNCLLSCYQPAKWTWQQASNGILLSFMPFSIICQDKISILHWASGSSLFLVSCPVMWWRNVNDYNIQRKGFRKGGKREHLCAAATTVVCSRCFSEERACVNRCRRRWFNVAMKSPLRRGFADCRVEDGLPYANSPPRHTVAQAAWVGTGAGFLPRPWTEGRGGPVGEHCCGGVGLAWWRSWQAGSATMSRMPRGCRRRSCDSVHALALKSTWDGLVTEITGGDVG